MFLTKPYKILPSINGKTSQKATQKGLAVCSMLITFLQEVMCVISGYPLVSVVRFKVQKRMPIFAEI